MNNAAYGANAGVGLGLFLTNAGNSTTLGGQFNTVTVSIGPVSVELDWSNGTWMLSATAGKGTGLPAGVMTLQTNTYSTDCQPQ
jgi:hypothetical protein